MSTIAVVGLGKIGLPLAAQFARKGHDVVGVDINPTTVETINAGREPFPGEAHLQDVLSTEVATGRLRATTSYADAVAADVHRRRLAVVELRHRRREPIRLQAPDR